MITAVTVGQETLEISEMGKSRVRVKEQCESVDEFVNSRFRFPMDIILKDFKFFIRGGYLVLCGYCLSNEGYSHMEAHYVRKEFVLKEFVNA